MYVSRYKIWRMRWEAVVVVVDVVDVVAAVVAVVVESCVESRVVRMKKFS